MALTAFSDYRLWLRIYDKRIITEDGVYAEDNLPIEYAGSELEIEYNQIMIFGTSAGSFVQFKVTDTSTLKDKDDKTGVGYTYDLYGKTFTKDAGYGDGSNVQVEWYKTFYPENFPNTGDEKMRYMHQQSMIQEGLVPEDYEFQDEP